MIILLFNVEKIEQLYNDFTNSLYIHDGSLYTPIAVKTSELGILFKILNKDENNNIQLIILYNKYKKEGNKIDSKDKNNKLIEEENLETEIDILGNVF